MNSTSRDLTARYLAIQQASNRAEAVRHLTAIRTLLANLDDAIPDDVLHVAERIAAENAGLVLHASAWKALRDACGPASEE